MNVCTYKHKYVSTINIEATQIISIMDNPDSVSTILSFWYFEIFYFFRTEVTHARKVRDGRHAPGLEHVHCVHDKTCKFFLPLPVITQVINLLNGIWRHHLHSNKVGQNSCPLILENNHSKFLVICVRFMYKYLALCYIFSFYNPTPFVFFKETSC